MPPTVDEGVCGTQAVSPSKNAHDSRSKEAAAHAAAAPHDSAGATLPPPERGPQPPGGGTKDKQPADVAEMYVSYYDVAPTESPRGKRVIDLLQRGQSPSSDESPRIKRVRGAACAGEERGPAQGRGAQGDRHGTRAQVEATRAVECSDPPAGRGGQPRCEHGGGEEGPGLETVALESAARSLEAALDRALFVLVTHSGPPEATCVAVRHALEEAGKQLRAGIDATDSTQAGSEDEALVLVDCAFSMLARMRACKDDMSGLRAWVASEWSNIVEGALAS